MDPQTERITALEQDLERLNEAGRCNALGGLETVKAVERIGQAVALNTASIESFERTIAAMQAQIDELIAKGESDG